MARATGWLPLPPTDVITMPSEERLSKPSSSAADSKMAASLGPSTTQHALGQESLTKLRTQCPFEIRARIGGCSFWELVGNYLQACGGHGYAPTRFIALLPTENAKTRQIALGRQNMESAWHSKPGPTDCQIWWIMFERSDEHEEDVDQRLLAPQ